MKVQFADSFGESIRRLIRRETWWYKTYSVLRYELPHFFKNIYIFRKNLWSHRWWDYRFTLDLMKTSLEVMEKGMHNGLEVRESRDKKIAKMQRAIQILTNIQNDSYIEMAESELGDLVMREWEFEDVPDKPGISRLVDNETKEEKRHNSKVFARARKIEESEWDELWVIFKGQDHKKFKKHLKTLTEEERNDNSTYYKWFDGTGLNGWWD
jgi:hypothetical protein